MKRLISALFALVIFTSSYAQTNALLGQYFQNMQAYNPAHTGMNEHLDLNLGMRQQWAGFDGAPKTFYLGANGVVNFNKSKIASDSGQAPGLKHGFGGYLLSDKQGPYKQSEISLTYAVHVPISKHTYLSMGASPSIYNAKIDLSEIIVKDMNVDPVYQSLLKNGSSNTYLHLNVGLSLYSKNYYISYSMMEAANARISGNKDISQEENSMRHHILGGYRFKLSGNMELMPNTFIRFDQTKPTLMELGLRARYLEKYWTGLSVRNDKTIIGMLGFTFNDNVKFGYSYEYKTGDISNYNSGTHELNLGLRLFNNSRFASFW